MSDSTEVSAGLAGHRPPALTGRIWGVLLRNEWFKVRKRIAFWLGFGFYTLITVMNQWQGFWERREGFRLPDVWSGVFGDDNMFLLFFAGISLILLTSTEFSWRTARQNVIDGLSKSQWFWGKSMLLPMIGLVYVGTCVLVPGVLAFIRTDSGATSGSLVPFSVWQATGGLALAFAAVGSLGFFLALAVRNTGGAMGVWFLWIIPLEQGIIPPLVGQFLPSLETWPQYLPLSASIRLLSFEAYDAPTFERIVAAAVEAGREAPVPPEVQPFVIACAIWTAIFMVGSHVWFRRRDL